jgi:hypothetical protein
MLLIIQLKHDSRFQAPASNEAKWRAIRLEKRFPNRRELLFVLAVWTDVYFLQTFFR